MQAFVGEQSTECFRFLLQTPQAVCPQLLWYVHVLIQLPPDSIYNNIIEFILIMDCAQNFGPNFGTGKDNISNFSMGNWEFQKKLGIPFPIVSESLSKISVSVPALWNPN